MGNLVVIEAPSLNVSLPYRTETIMTNSSELILEDPLHEREIFASEVVTVAAVHGNISITFANIRIDEPTGCHPPKARRVVSARLMLTTPAARQLLQHLQRFAAQVDEVATRGKPDCE